MHAAGLRTTGRYIAIASLPLLGAGALLAAALLVAPLRNWLAGFRNEAPPPAKADDHDHAHPPHGASASPDAIELSPQARRSIGLATGPVKLQPFERSINVPGIVTERSGPAKFVVSAPVTGVVTQVAPVRGAALAPGADMFDVRITHEELVQSQADFLRTAEELEVVKREVARIDKATRGGAIAEKSLLERQYEQRKLEAVFHSQQQALLLHGLAQPQIDEILSTHKLVSTMRVRAAVDDAPAGAESPAEFYQVQEVAVVEGQHVDAGDRLATLADHSELLIEGNAFENDIAAIEQAAAKEWPLAAVFENSAGKPLVVEGIRLLYVGSHVDPANRTLPFYAVLPNRKVRDATVGGRRFVDWQFKPGQRVSLRVPVEQLPERIVLPVDAVAQDGVENFVFQANGKQFVRRPVQVEHRDESLVVVANDGALFVGETIAMSGAQQLSIALKNKAGGPIDPHAGHNH